MKFIRFLFIAILLTTFFSCKTRRKVTIDAPTKRKEIVSFKLIQLNDAYEIAPINGGLYGGMARVAYVRDSIKKQFPNTYMFLAGDFLNPSLLSSMKYQGNPIQGKQMIEVMNGTGQTHHIFNKDSR